MGCGGSKGTKCYLELAVNDSVIGRLVVELRADEVPKTAENFRQLCTGENGNSYAGTTIHRIVPGFIAQGGDCGKSIYGKKFDDENFKLLHKGKGVLSMANTGPHTNGTQFFISLGDCSELDGKNVVFGKVVEGKEVLEALNDLGTTAGSTKSKVTIHSCGEL
ncbi:peptidyl-prolyl cis-trans isomerase A1 [Physcomitrium patens]|uniref:Peptidyl-prolyl cis-trans isomerase n=1 Tax=Physcomitrium patens TaxID=3218 RepID=A9S1Y7_PHYPA|nr:peptidyl-prolyl cis-trans isomerase A1-like [Physcomitrium patens]PNR50943.1 hypothetical protein PHYPA_010129 [Physcomitrium patens]|eukprot:XP_024381658.1 peptidyl-prolyl cis-trans isomerase A1-like [Physcomitrella patens]